MKNLFISAILMIVFMSVSFSQTVDEILAKHFEAVGQEKLLATNTIMMKGKIIQQSFEIPFTSYQKRPMNFRSEAEFQGMKILSGFDGTMGWSINPMMGSSDPMPMTAEENDRMKIQADYDGLFYNYKEKGYTIELLSNEKVDDIDTYVLKLTRPNGDIITSYIDAENYVLLKSKSKIKIQEKDTETEVIFSNYKYVNEILNPFSMETKMNGQTVMQMTFDEISYDTDMPDSMFKKPEITAPADTTGSK